MVLKKKLSVPIMGICRNFVLLISFFSVPCFLSIITYLGLEFEVLIYALLTFIIIIIIFATFYKKLFLMQGPILSTLDIILPSIPLNTIG